MDCGNVPIFLSCRPFWANICQTKISDQFAVIGNFGWSFSFMPRVVTLSSRPLGRSFSSVEARTLLRGFLVFLSENLNSFVALPPQTSSALFPPVLYNSPSLNFCRCFSKVHSNQVFVSPSHPAKEERCKRCHQLPAPHSRLTSRLTSLFAVSALCANCTNPSPLTIIPSSPIRQTNEPTIIEKVVLLPPLRSPHSTAAKVEEEKKTLYIYKVFFRLTERT